MGETAGSVASDPRRLVAFREKFQEVPARGRSALLFFGALSAVTLSFVLAPAQVASLDVV
jgi:hypothetical protein